MDIVNTNNPVFFSIFPHDFEYKYSCTNFYITKVRVEDVSEYLETGHRKVVM